MTSSRRHEPPRLPDTPEEGYYLVRMVAKGPRVPAMVNCGFRWRASVCGMWLGADFDPFKAPYVMHICNYGTRITEAEYERLMSDPRVSTLDPFTPVDVRTLPVEEF
jgi:hypothetical protein